MSHLRDFVFGLSSQPDALKAFRENPERAMQEAGLTSEEQSALQKGDPQVIRPLLAADDPGGGPDSVTVVIWTHVHVKHVIAADVAGERGGAVASQSDSSLGRDDE